MTVCIAAICENGKNVVVAADRMFTSPLNVEFETEERKIETLGNFCVVLSSGNSAHATEVVDTVRHKLQDKKEFTLTDIANDLKNRNTAKVTWAHRPLGAFSSGAPNL